MYIRSDMMSLEMNSPSLESVIVSFLRMSVPSVICFFAMWMW